MAKMKFDIETAQELREKSINELQETLTSQTKQLIHSRFMHASARLEKTSTLKSLRRSIARIKTILQEKQRG